MAQGGAKDWAKVRQQDIFEALEVRFGAVPEEVRTKVGLMTDESRLRRVHRLAITEPSLDGFVVKL
jgi:hypothetical protein